MMRCLRTIWYVLNLRCEEAERLRAKETAGDMTTAERLGERLHGIACHSCRKARKQARLLDERLGRLRSGLEAGLDSSGQLPVDARERIRAALQEEQANPNSPKSA